MSAVLQTAGLAAGYGGRPVINDIDVVLNPGEVLCMIGHNGAGKSTLLKSMFGLIAPDGGQVLVDGKDMTGCSPREMADTGIALVPEGRGVFPSLSVTDIFALGMHAARVPKPERPERVDWVLGILPVIREFMHRPASTLSGGQQQMVSIGRALLSRPRILLMDEPSIGLAPKLFQDLLAPIRALQQREGLSILLVEQNVREALKISDRAVVMKSGRMIWEGAPEELSDNDKLMGLY
ncbi:ATP-binding cassette domain-containing protein [Pseudooceanicola sp. 216_PA32_1]|uniref:ATP-binding cassette domain-containing protein n=1 Tax=Pseudooceanicola pacificus TaxID=2676438 RepID=A0A844WEY2_9RHOB|nr:ABC transporter ATP-binding protein [Pseudooceanicola pacificus]MWB78740.1 ATP-binding cassette domain-containing protein [Pseudooceanicola pacificus]